MYSEVPEPFTQEATNLHLLVSIQQAFQKSKGAGGIKQSGIPT